MATVEVDNSDDLVDKFLQLYESGDFSDIEIKVGSRRFQTHRIVLCMGSDVLKTMLMSKIWPEGRSNRVVLQEDQECVDVFGSFLSYLYSGRVTLDKSTVLPLLILADKYNVSHLSESCLDYMDIMCCQESIANVISWLQYAVICGYTDIEDTCKYFITNNFDSVIRKAEFLDIHKDALIKLLECSNLVVCSEFALYEALRNWLQHHELEDKVEADRQFREIMKHVRFPMMHLSDLVILENDSWMKRYKDFLLEKIFTSLRYHIGQPIVLPSSVFKESETKTQFRPRVYMKETWSTEIYVRSVSTLTHGEVQGAFFSTPVSCSDSDQYNHHDWNVMFYPKGVKYDPCLMIGVVGVGVNLVNTGGFFKTVRLALCTNCESRRRFKVTVMVLRGGTPAFVYSSLTKDAIFDKDHSRFNFDDVIPYEEILKPTSPYKIDGDDVKIRIVVRPQYLQIAPKSTGS